MSKSTAKSTGKGGSNKNQPTKTAVKPSRGDNKKQAMKKSMPTKSSSTNTVNTTVNRAKASSKAFKQMDDYIKS